MEGVPGRLLEHLLSRYDLSCYGDIVTVHRYISPFVL